MKARTIAVVTLALVLLALVLWRRRPETRPVASARPAEGPRKPLARSEQRPAARSLAGGRSLLRISLALGAIALAALGIWRLTTALGPDGGGEARAALVGVTATPAPPTPPPPTSVPTPPQTWRLLAGGDVLMDLTEGAGIDPFAGLVPPLSSAELAAVNVEMSIATGGSPEVKSFVFQAPPSAAATWPPPASTSGAWATITPSTMVSTPCSRPRPTLRTPAWCRLARGTARSKPTRHEPST